MTHNVSIDHQERMLRHLEGQMTAISARSMSDISNEKPHQRFGSGYGVLFWRDQTASNEESATRATVYTGLQGMPLSELYFDLPAERIEMEKLERALTKAFAAGDAHARQEIRDALGVPRR